MNCQMCQNYIDNELSLLQTLGLLKNQKKLICQACESDFAVITMSCSGCGRQQKSTQLCRDCRRWQQQGKILLKHTALYQYNDAMRSFMQQYKFNGDYKLRGIFNPQFIQIIKSLSKDVIVPIPVSENTMKTRGFNQTTGLLEGIIYQELLQVTTIKKSHQSQFNRKARMLRQQPFTLKESSISLRGKHVLLVDDIYTTGNTLYHAADLLYSAGAINVESISLAR